MSILLEIKLNEFYLLLYVTVDGQWATWGSWTTCSVTCGGGSQSRTRTCTNPAPQYNGSPCPNSASSTQACNTHHCPSKCDHFLWNNSKNTFIPRPLCNDVRISLQSMGGWAAGAPGARAPSRAEEEHRIGWGHVQTPSHSTAGRCVSEQRRTPRTAIHKSA